MQVAIYLRKSRAEEQADATQTLARHKEILTEFASVNRLSVVAVYEEVVSGESLYTRPQMLKLLESVGAGDYDAVLCMDIDRLGRGGMKDQGVILDTFKYSDTKIITPDKAYDLNDDSDEELTEFKAFFSRRELKIINKRLRRGLHRAISNGAYVSNAPYGYRRAEINGLPSLEAVEEEAHFVRMAFQLYIDGNGCSLIADHLTSLGATPRRGTGWNRNSVLKMLKNPAYIGKVIWNQKQHIRPGSRGNTGEKNLIVYNPRDKWTIVDGEHKAIISEDIYNTVQGIMKRKYQSPSMTGEVKSPLAGLVVCSKCGRRMQRMGENKGVPYLLCIKKGCSAGTKLEYVEQDILNYLRKRLEEIRIEAAEGIKSGTAHIQNMIEASTRELSVLTNQKNNLHDLLEQGIYDIATYQERFSSIAKKIHNTKSILENQQAELEKVLQRDNKELSAKIENALHLYKGGDAKTRNMLLKSVIRNITYHKEKKTKPRDYYLEISLLWD